MQKDHLRMLEEFQQNQQNDQEIPSPKKDKSR